FSFGSSSRTTLILAANFAISRPSAATPPPARFHHGFGSPPPHSTAPPRLRLAAERVAGPAGVRLGRPLRLRRRTEVVRAGGVRIGARREPEVGAALFAHRICASQCANSRSRPDKVGRDEPPGGGARPEPLALDDAAPALAPGRRRARRRLGARRRLRPL